MISKLTIQKINDEARVEDVVGEFVTLKKRGANLLGLCPFHNEKTPSFNVNPARNIYKCFGCGKAGGPVQFLMDYQQMSFPDALRYLAKKYNISIEEDKQTDDEKQKEFEKQNLTESIYIANAFAQRFFTGYMFNNEAGKIGLAYFKERGFLNHTIEKFQLGFAPDAPDALTKAGLKEGYQLDILKKAGLTSPKENSTYDFFRNRVMFPVHNMTGKVVAFGGRIMMKDEKALHKESFGPKYVNTPESEVYQKSKILYGANFAKNEIRKKDECLLVEGYTDVISLHQAGIENAVASSGTSLTQDQIRLIKRITPNITILYDGDAAGIKAALRGTDLILEEGMNVRVVILPPTEDPDSLVRKSGEEAFNKYIRENRKDLILFKTSLFAEEAKKDPIKKAELIRDIVNSIGKIPDSIQRSIYIKECYQLFDLDEQVLITEVNKQRRKKAAEQAKETAKQQEQSEGPKDSYGDALRREQGNETLKADELPQAIHKEQLNEGPAHLHIIEHDIIRILMEFGTEKPDGEETVVQYVLKELEGLEIETPKYKTVYELVKREFADGRIHTAKFFSTHDDEQISSVAIEVLAQPYSLSENWEKKFGIHPPAREKIYPKDVQSAVIRFKQFRNIAELKKIEKKLKETPDEADIIRLMKLHKLLMEQKTEYARTVGNVVYRPKT